MTLSDTIRRRTHRDRSTREERRGRSQSTVRASAWGRVPVELTVNGTAVTLQVEPRLTLADALRDLLGLTGTHLGCEHGVCGMCTVLVDGDAVRACLLFACQLNGSEIITVEGLGRADDLHPLQTSFGRHHALQCGFCTPGFLMSSYGLLRDHPGVDRDDLPKELSGVLCRCTGYRNIIDAVDEVATEHRDGVPEPRNCRPSTLVGRHATNPSLHTDRQEDREHAGAAAAEHPEEVRLPATGPTVTSRVTSDLGASVPDVWKVIEDTALLVRCLPGAELTEALGDDWFRGRAKVSLGPVRLSFAGVAHVVERDTAGRRLRVLAQGQDAGGGRVQADIRLHVEPSGGESRLRADADLYLTGRIAQFGRSLAEDVSTQMFKQFSTAVSDAAEGRQPTTAAKAPNALRVVLNMVRGRLRAARHARRARTR